LNNENYKKPKCGEIWEVWINNAVGHQQGGKRPVLITSNNIGNYYSPTVDGITFTSKIKKQSQLTHALFKAGEANLPEDSILLAEQKLTINKNQLIRKIGMMNDDQLTRASIAVAYANPIFMKAYEAGVQNTVEFKRLALAY
jgi:mRNA interferase MazF